jgi:general stress protein YciG
MAETTAPITPRKPRGFAAMPPELQRELASRGGKAAHAQNRGHEWTIEEARAAGRAGGLASRGGRGKLPVPPATK